MKPSTIALFLFGFLLFGSVAIANDLFDARDVAQKSESRYKGEDSSTALEMRLVNSSGKERVREFVRYYKVINGQKTTLLKFLKPDDIKDTGTLNIEVKGEADVQHLYLPAARKLRRVSAKNQSWVGSDFSFEDLEELEVEDYNFEALRMENFGGYECYVYAMTPKTSDKSIYGKQIRWVAKDLVVPLKIEYYEKNGQLLKVMEAADIRNIQGAYYAWEIKCQNVQDKHQTLIKRLWIFLNTNLEDDLLSLRQLQKSIVFYKHPADMWGAWDAAHASKKE